MHAPDTTPQQLQKTYPALAEVITESETQELESGNMFIETGPVKPCDVCLVEEIAEDGTVRHSALFKMMTPDSKHRRPSTVRIKKIITYEQYGKLRRFMSDFVTNGGKEIKCPYPLCDHWFSPYKHTTLDDAEAHGDTGGDTQGSVVSWFRYSAASSSCCRQGISLGLRQEWKRVDNKTVRTRKVLVQANPAIRDLMEHQFNNVVKRILAECIDTEPLNNVFCVEHLGATFMQVDVTQDVREMLLGAIAGTEQKVILVRGKSPKEPLSAEEVLEEHFVPISESEMPREVPEDVKLLLLQFNDE